MAVGLPASITSLLSQTRSVTITISINGTDLSSKIQPSLKSLVYKESFMSNTNAYSLDFSIADPEGLFRQTISLNTTMTVDCSISMVNWQAPITGTLTKQLSQMYIRKINITAD